MNKNTAPAQNNPTKQNLHFVHDYYCAPRNVGENSMNIYQIWENGGAFQDSVTPSTYSQEYRDHITDKIAALTSEQAQIFSIGCGNGFVEGALAARARLVRAIDCNDEAVQLTRKKGVDAFKADFFSLPANTLSDCAVIYADGLLGHLFDAQNELQQFFAHLQAQQLRSGTYLVFTNDAPKDPTARFTPHDKLADFWFLSKEYLQDCLSKAGFIPVESYYFRYSRPLSGPRNRNICIARVA